MHYKKVYDTKWRHFRFCLFMPDDEMRTQWMNESTRKKKQLMKGLNRIDSSYKQTEQPFYILSAYANASILFEQRMCSCESEQVSRNN